jgi:APA family basic amino acid/polyamine antiporter
MIGSGIFIVSSIIARQVGAPGWLLVVWLVTGLLTLMAALSYGELAAMMPKAGGQYVYLREAFSPLWGFLYGWTLFLVIQTGTIAAVAVGFARYTGVLIPWVSESNYFVEPIRFGGYAFSLSTAQFIGLAMIALLTFMNTRGLNLGKLVQNIFTTAKTGALIALIVLGIVVGVKSGAGAANFSDFWTLRGGLQDVGQGLTAATAFGLFVGICVAQTNSLFSADAWNNITFTAGEVKDPRRNIPLLARVRHISGDRPLSSGQRRIFGGAPFRRNPECAERSRCVGDGQRDLSRRGRDHHGRRYHGFHLWLQ